MSYSTVVAYWPGQNFEELRDIPNSRRLALLLWDLLSRRYLGVPERQLKDDKDLWGLWKRSDIPHAYRRCLLMTFDNALIAANDYAQAVNDIRALTQEFPELGGKASAWEELALELEAVPASPWVGLRVTSMADHPFVGPFNEKTEDYDPVDPSVFWSVYGESLE